MSKMRFVGLSALLGSVALVSGCASITGRTCLKAPAEADTQDHAPLRIPVGLDAPDTRSALKIPEPPETVAAPGPQGRCLEDPPAAAFQASSPAPAAVEKERKAEKPSRTRPMGPRRG
jgi:hypothetical protein